MTVSRAAFQSALEAAQLPVLLAVTQPQRPTPGPEGLPNIHLSKMQSANGVGSIITNPKAVLEALKHKVLGYPNYAAHPPGPRAAVAAARDSLERRLARVLSECAILDCDDLGRGIAAAHEKFHAAGYPAMDRVTLLSRQVWDRYCATNPVFAAGARVGPGLCVWGRYLCLLNPYLEVQAVALHRLAVEGDIVPLDAAEGHAASASVRAELIHPDGAYVLQWR